MKKCLSIIVVMGAALLLGAAHPVKAQGSQPGHAIEPLDESICMFNHFSGVVSDCEHNPVSGETVTLTDPSGTQETDVTNSEGRYCFARPIPFPSGSAWEPGYYGLTTRCMGRLVYREGNGDINVNLSVCCPGR
jgi:hypothetical protein